MNGYSNELNFVNYLNGHKVKKLNIMLLELIEALFDNVNEDDVITAWKNPFKQKTDIFIKINNIKKRISIKTGSKNSVHMEPISEFIHFLIDNNVSKESVVEYLRYQYADSSTNGTGKIRISSEEYKKTNQDKLDKLNEELNQKYILSKAVDRFVLKGNNDIYYIDALIYGTVNDFLFLTKSEIKEVVLSKINFYATGIHFGPLFCQPMNRCLNYNVKYDKLRFCVQIKWYSLLDDILEYKNKKLKEEIKKLPCI